MSIGCPGRPFATADPKLDDLLPADDATWDQGVSYDDLSGLDLINGQIRLPGQILTLRCLRQ